MISGPKKWLLLVVLAASSAALNAAPDSYSFEKAQAFLNQYCRACHQGKASAGGFNVQRVSSPVSLQKEARKWTSLTLRVTNGEMPPKGSPAPALDQREPFTQWVDGALRAEACAAGVAPGPALIRRLNRDEYTATIRDLLDIHMDIGHALPLDGAGGEGFDNTAETLFLSPLHSGKYMEIAKFAVDFAAKEYKSRAKILVAKPGPDVSPDQAAARALGMDRTNLHSGFGRWGWRAKDRRRACPPKFLDVDSHALRAWNC
jgi:mono/diheme cytochrome c family protein